MAAASEFHFKYLEGFVGTRLYQSLLKLELDPTMDVFNSFSLAGHFFFGGVLPSQPTLT